MRVGIKSDNECLEHQNPFRVAWVKVILGIYFQTTYITGFVKLSVHYLTMRAACGGGKMLL